MLMLCLEPGRSIWLPTGGPGRGIQVASEALTGHDRVLSLTVPSPVENDLVNVSIGGRTYDVRVTKPRGAGVRFGLDIPHDCVIRYNDRKRQPVKGAR